jgi:alkylation response protein AidB-like acyl-CoA dehydrogenase
LEKGYQHFEYERFEKNDLNCDIKFLNNERIGDEKMFELTEEQKDIQKAVREFAEKEIEPIGQEHDQSEEFPHEVHKKACDLGYIAVTIPEEYGGAGLDQLTNVIIGEELCRADSGIGYCLQLVAIGVPMLLMYGTDEQKEKYVSMIPKGGICALGITEPDAGSDVVSIKTRAVKDGNEWVISGSKMYCTNALIANWVTLMTVTDPEAGHRGLSAFIVETDREGFEASPIDKMGRHAQPTCDVALQDIRVPKENLIGKEGRGFYQVMDQLAVSRVNTAAVHVGIAQGAIDRALKYAEERKAFKRSISEFQYIQHKLVDMEVSVEAARYFTYRAAWKIDQGYLPTRDAAIAKLIAGEVARKVTIGAIDVYGGHGYAREFDVERFCRDAMAGPLVEGSSAILKNTIANVMLGKLPAEKKLRE